MTPAALLFWLPSAVAGAIVAFAVLSLGTYGLIPFIVLLLIAIRLSGRTTAVGGSLFGFGAAATFAFIASLALFAGISLTWLPRRSRHSSR